MVSEKKIFEYFFTNLRCMSHKQPIKLSDLDKSHMKNGGLPNKYFCKKELKCPPMSPIISLLELRVALATSVLINLERKTQFM